MEFASVIQAFDVRESEILATRKFFGGSHAFSSAGAANVQSCLSWRLPCEWNPGIFV